MLTKILNNALGKAYKVSDLNSDNTTDKKKRNRNISTNWVKSLVTEFEEYYKSNENGLQTNVFSKFSDIPHREYKIKEFLYDITVIQSDYITSASKKVQIPYPSKVLWHIESEFQSNNSRASLYDFSKLLMSGAQNRLIILPSGGAIQSWATEKFPQLRNHTQGKMFLAFIPHPRKWEKEMSLHVDWKELW